MTLQSACAVAECGTTTITLLLAVAEAGDITADVSVTYTPGTTTQAGGSGAEPAIDGPARSGGRRSAFQIDRSLTASSWSSRKALSGSEIPQRTTSSPFRKGKQPSPASARGSNAASLARRDPTLIP